MDLSALYVIVVLVCIVLSAFFSACETALTSLPQAKVRQMVEERHRGALALRLWLERPTRVLTTILVGNNIVNVLAASIATVLATQYLEEFAISAATVGITLALLIFGEITPKTFARNNPVLFAPIAMTLLLPVYWFLFPLIISLSWLATRLVHLFGAKSHSSGPMATEEDIAFMIRLGHQEGVLKREEGEMLESVIEFRDTIVRETMVPRMRICALEKYASLESILAAVKEESHSRWPVYDGNIDNVVGIFHAKDLLRIVQEKKQDFQLSHYLRPALFVPDTMKIGSLLKEFQHGKAHLAIVVDEYGGTAGVISLEDVLEELVGDIRDEYDSEEEERVIQKINTKHYVIKGGTGIYDVGEALSIRFPENELYDSMGGFLTVAHGKMPHVGSEIIFEGWSFIVTEADEKRVITVDAKQLEHGNTSQEDQS